ncbi:cache domain-containing protein [Moritella sp.]|uniref:bifunctional diguanylate cyclase/phosphodiesterase n=1 Tax=Moritella sp. TaxID=78556 RepID=UPI001DB96A26|nr:cache domain-containing protein [Moritella sp.]MCJ8349146.1 cache domain-containing protein [Moritella sp.]NQZ39434.1 cache domain-containing protein [Moritella sp.]
MTHDLKILRLIKVIPPIIVIIFAILVNVIIISNNQATLKDDIKTLRQDFIKTEKELVKFQVQQLVQDINYEKNSTRALLKKDIKARVYQAHRIATTIYEANKHKSEVQVTKLITDALRSIRFNQGRGYYFIYKTNGLNVMHSTLPVIEGTSKWDYQDIKGNYVVRDMGQLAKSKGEGFSRWWFEKPQNKNKDFEKIGFSKHFSPYDWFIGTGEYVIDVENDIKQRLLQRISNISYGTNRYIFVIDYQGNYLSHNPKDLKRYNNNNNHSLAVMQNIVFVAKQGEDYLHYTSSEMPSTAQPTDKISYIVGLPDWEWAIGSGVYISDIENYLTTREKAISQQHQDQLSEILWLSLFVTLFFVTLSLFLANYLGRRFALYENQISTDFSELNKVKEQLQYQALHDSLTKLPNRILLDIKIEQGIALSNKNNKKLAIMFVDLDDFKKINDLYGHSVGDELLATLGTIFNQMLSAGDSVARFGGDEFIFCFPELENLADAERKAKHISEIFKQHFVINGKSIYSSCSIGVAMYPDDGHVAEQLISKADIVLYKSKLQQKGHFLFFNDTINTQVQRDLLLESELHLAIAKNELDVLYQPQIDAATGQIYGVEALVRWYNTKLGHVSPVEFIQVAEDVGIINDIGNFVIKKSLQDILQFNNRSNTQLHLSINISPKQLMEPDFVSNVINLTNEMAVDNRLITLEITENVLINDLAKVQPVLQSIRNSGMKLSLDDFGTGYSSLSYLSNLPIDEIKIDRSFIDKLLTNDQSESLVKTIIAIGQFCDLTVIAEGVETKEQYDHLRHYRCDLVQGYYFDRPLSLAALISSYQTSRISHEA